MKPNILKAMIGGFVGTVALTLFMQFVTAPLSGFTIDIAAMMGQMLGVSHLIGSILHFMMGTILFPLIFVYVYGYLFGSPMVRGMMFAIPIFLGAVFVIIPLTGAGFLLANLGGMTSIALIFVAHMIYGGLLGLITGRP